MNATTAESGTMTATQESFWLLSQIAMDDPACNVATAVRLEGALDARALQLSVDAVVARHTAMRMSFPAEEGRPRAVVADRVVTPFELVDCSAGPQVSRLERMMQLANAQAMRAIDPGVAPLLRVHLFRLATHDHVLLVTAHHMIWDGWSYRLFARELSDCYGAFAEGRTPDLAEPSLSYGAYADQERVRLDGRGAATHVQYWVDRLADRPPLALPTDRPRPPLRRYRGAAHSVPLVVAASSDRLATTAREINATPYMLLLAIFDVLLLRYTQQEDISVATPIAAREEPGTDELIGCCINTVLIRTDLSANPSFQELVDRVRDGVLDAFDHRDVPLERLAAELRRSQSSSGAMLFEAMLAYQNVPQWNFSFANVVATPFTLRERVALTDLTLNVWQRPEGLVADFVYDTDLFDHATIVRMGSDFVRLLESAIDDPTLRVSDLAVLGEPGHQQRMCEWNGTPVPLRDVSIQHLFEEQVRRAPEQTALLTQDKRIAYGTLDRRANGLAHRLRTSGIGREDVVGLCVPMGIDAIVGLLAILKAGAAVLPLDPAYPRDRLAYMLEDSAAATVVAEAEALQSLPSRDLNVITVAGETMPVGPATITEPNDLAYLIYTSGSTGRPKGVELPHRAIVSRVAYEPVSIGPGERWCVKTSLGFIDSLWEIFAPLTRGLSTAVADDVTARDPLALVHLLADKEVTRIVLVPSLLQAMLDLSIDLAAHLPRLRCWISSGEALPSALAERFGARLPGRLLVNLYGTSETWDVTWHRCSGAPAARVPIGHPVANARVLILDGRRQPVPLGATGELYVGGPGLARGYRNLPELTAECFVADPFTDARSTLFRTGDLARFRADGTLECLGRADRQLKLRGVRIEAEEIEGVLLEDDRVVDAAISVEGELPATAHLIAYVVCADRNECQLDQLRPRLQQRLPPQMIPTHVVTVDRLVRTPSGKLDRNRLPAARRPEPSRHRIAPRNRMEKMISAIWATALDMGNVGVHDDFFALGGHSLLATQVVARIGEALGHGISVRLVFEAPTVAEMAARLSGPAAADYRSEPIPLASERSHD